MAENVIYCPYCVTGVVNKLTATCNNPVCQHAFNKKDLRRIVTGKYTVDPRFVVATAETNVSNENVSTMEDNKSVDTTVINNAETEVNIAKPVVEAESSDIENVAPTEKTEVTRNNDVIDSPTLVSGTNMPGLKKPKIKSTKSSEAEAREREEREAKERKEREEAEARECEEREAKERKEREEAEAREREEREAKERKEREEAEAREREEREAKERKEREEAEAREREEREANERREREEAEAREREAKEREEAEAREREEREEQERQAKIAEMVAEKLEEERLAREEKERQDEYARKKAEAERLEREEKERQAKEKADLDAAVEAQFREKLKEEFGEETSVMDDNTPKEKTKAEMFDGMVKKLAVQQPVSSDYESDDEDDFEEEPVVEKVTLGSTHKNNNDISLEEEVEDSKNKKLSPADKARKLLNKKKAAKASKEEWVEGDLDKDFNEDGYYDDTPIEDKTEPSYISFVEIGKLVSFTIAMILFTIFLIFKG